MPGIYPLPVWLAGSSVVYGRRMTPETSLILFVACAVWSLAVAIKATLSLRGDEPYRFAIWDGGLIRAGKTLKRRGVKLKRVLMVLMAATILAIAARSLDPDLGLYLVIGFGVVSLGADFAFEGDDHEPVPKATPTRGATD